MNTDEDLPLLPDQIRLSAGGGGWMGTFALAVEFVVGDLLEDGPGIVVRAVVDRGDDGLEVYTGEVIEIREGDLVFVDGRTVASADIASVTI